MQAVIVPCGLTATLPEAEKNKLLDKCKELEDRLKAAGIRAKGDYRDNYSPGWKFNHWELKVFCQQRQPSTRKDEHNNNSSEILEPEQQLKTLLNG